jgi:hypothetical protein
MVFDYKENWNTRTFLQEETSWDHWNPNGISHIAFVLLYKEKGLIYKRVYNYLSEAKRHDTKFTVETLRMVRVEKEMQNISKLNLFCDVGPHFYNKFILHHIFNTPLFGNKNVTLSFFPEHHGKSYCDSAFGTLSKAVRSNLPLPQVQSCADLIEFFVNLKVKDTDCFRKIKDEHIFREYDIF